MIAPELFTQPFVQTQIKENIVRYRIPLHDAVVGQHFITCQLSSISITYLRCDVYRMRKFVKVP